MNDWVKCSDQMPEPGVPVIAYVPSYGGGGHDRRIRAAYAAPKTLPLHIDAEGGEYDEETDTYWCEQGWYETNEYEECHWAVTDEVTHWMPLPPPPVATEIYRSLSARQSPLGAEFEEVWDRNVDALYER